jgi:hypothetical protein
MGLRVWIALIWLMIMSSDSVLWTKQWTFRILLTATKPWITERLAAAQEILCSMDLDILKVLESFTELRWSETAHIVRMRHKEGLTVLGTRHSYTQTNPGGWRSRVLSDTGFSFAACFSRCIPSPISILGVYKHLCRRRRFYIYSWFGRSSAVTKSDTSPSTTLFLFSLFP